VVAAEVARRAEHEELRGRRSGFSEVGWFTTRPSLFILILLVTYKDFDLYFLKRLPSEDVYEPFKSRNRLLEMTLEYG